MDQESDTEKKEQLAVEMIGIVKRFPGVLANDHVNFELREGEIHALLGENGAGKSTLMNILAGLYRQDAGMIKVKWQSRGFPFPAGRDQRWDWHGASAFHASAFPNSN